MVQLKSLYFNDNKELAKTGGFSLMYYYRLYYLDLGNHHIIDVRDFRANTDAAAVVKAGSPLSGETRELWNQGRRVLELSN
jgi:hypothetical protein